MSANIRGVISSLVILSSQIFVLFKQYSTAERLIQRHMEKHPEETTNMLLLLGDLYEKTNQGEKAIECYQKGCDKEPNEWSHHWELGCLFEKLGKKEQALSHYNKALSLEPDIGTDFLENLRLKIAELKNSKTATPQNSH
jgi:tetratricopeptide (TPR) repeat protein